MKRLLIANRGEITRRIIRTAKRMGIETVAIYSDADTESLHVREADFSYRLDGVAPRQTYLDIDKVMEAVRVTGADALHPGYGFLSENPE
ncbi:MAG: biotin carboxylase N-terminal domain-containing protein, partial [Bacteroidota bacterium]